MPIKLTLSQTLAGLRQRVDFFVLLFGTLRNNAYLCGVKKRKEEMSKQEKEEKAKEFWEYYETTQGTITIADPIVLD